ncbi:MAG TPA: lytic transglycosylase domain-containing protein [Terriglobia bacterium]|nr:lytic transglycosylase domain-containing protein [Terriglobia bacterium]
MFRLLNCLIALSVCAAAFGADGGGVGSPKSAEVGQVGCQVAVLVNRFTIQYSRRETVDAVTRLWLCGVGGVTGYLEVPRQQIERFEHGEAPFPLASDSPPAAQAREKPAVGNSIENLIRNVALRHQVDPDFVASVVKAESGFNPRAVSAKGAQGLMQLMPQTAEKLGVENAFDPTANVEAGTKYLRQLLELYGGDAAKALAAYNAGPQTVKQYGGIPPYRETRAYVVRIIRDFNAKKLEQLAKSHTAKH